MSWEELSAPDRNRYAVVINHEEQYSLWPARAPDRQGWKRVGFEGSRIEAQAYIEEVWTDMRPLSLRKLAEKYKDFGAAPKEVWTDMRP